MLPATLYAQTQIDALGAGATRIAFAVRVGCARALRMLHSAQAPWDGVWAQLEAAACLPPLDQVPAARLRQDVTSNADALLGCGSPHVIAAFASLLPKGSEPAGVPTIAFHAVAAQLTPEVLTAALALFDPEALLAQAFLATVGKPGWEAFWKAQIPVLARHPLPVAFWMAPAICTLAEGANAELHIDQVRALITQAKPHRAKDYDPNAIPKMPKPESAGALLWLERAAFAHLLDADGATAYAVMARKKALDVNTSVANTDSWLAARAIWRQTDGHAPWGTDPVRYLLTPQAERTAALLALTEPVWEAPKTAKPLTKAKLPKRKPRLKAFSDDAHQPLTVTSLWIVAERYTAMVDVALSTHDETLRTEALAEAQAMRALLGRPVAREPSNPGDYLVLQDAVIRAIMETGAVAFREAGKTCTTATFGLDQWENATWHFDAKEKIDIAALVRRAEVAFMVEAVPRLNRAQTWKALVFAQHKPKMAGPLLNALDTPEQKSGWWEAKPQQGTTHLGAAMTHGKGQATLGIGYSRALWDITDPGMRVDIFHRLEKGNGFQGVPGRNVHDFETEGAGPDLFLLHVMLHAQRHGVAFEEAGRRVKRPCLVRDLIAAGQGTAFFQRFATIDAFVATPWEDIAATAAGLLDGKRLA
jgi:hypothetical protein